MSTIDREIILTIVISTLLILSFGLSLIYFLFRFQRKRDLHKREVMELKESFNKILLNSKIEIQEQTLDHISKELHSNIGQLASLININLSEILINTNQKESILETKSLTKQLLSELKVMSATLNTDFIMKIGFDKALRKELDRVSKAVKYPTYLNIQGEVFNFEPEREIILFRLCQEIINNSIKYAKASEINVNLNYQSEFLNLNIEDNGVGFDINSVNTSNNSSDSTGLINIDKRAKVINAKIEIFSNSNEGTRVFLQIPR